MTTGRRPLPLAALVGGLLAIALGGVAAAPAGAAPAAAVPTSTAVAPVAAAAASPADAARYPCRGYGALDASNPVAQVEKDVFAWGGFAPAKVGNGRHDIDWKADPYRRPSWRTWFHSLYWTGALIKKSTQGITRQRDPNAIDGAVAIAADWVRDNRSPWPTGPGAGNATMTRTDHLLCLRGALVTLGRPVPAWLDTSLVQHATWLRDHTWPDHNVGTDQTIAMLGVGCVLGRGDLRDLAASRLASRITRVIDAQGANNEQSVGYARWNHELWGQAERALDACGVDSPARATIASRRAGLMRFLDQATQPDGTLAMIGDTDTIRLDASKSPVQEWILRDGAAGVPPAQRVAVYAAGYVFGRSGWGTGARRPSQESAYTLRFGPKRVGHGHNDHTALTWHTRGRPILVDPGVGEYVDDAWRDFYTGPTAHNQLVMPRMRTSPTTALRRSRFVPGADFVELADAPLPGATRRRGVLMLADPDIAVVVDAATSTAPTTFTQLWHLPADQALRASGTRAVAARSGDATTTTLLQLPVGAAKAGAFGVVRGATRPIQGWVWPDAFHRRPAPVATVTRSGRSAVVATAIVAAPTGAKVAMSASAAGRSTVYTFTVGGRSAVVALAADGTLTRLR